MGSRRNNGCAKTRQEDLDHFAARPEEVGLDPVQAIGNVGRPPQFGGV
jgi:hypothetical protein